MNIKMTYLYRDGGNYKYRQDVVFSNRASKTVEQLTEEIRKHLISGQFFDQSLAPVPIEYTEPFDPELDHTWLEFDSFEAVDEPAQVEEDVTQFINRL